MPSTIYDGFEEHRSPRDEDIDAAIKQATIVIDTNVLLDLYRYGSTARSELLAILGDAGVRLWVPHQVMKEFWSNRNQIVAELRRPSEHAAAIGKKRAELEQEVNRWSKRTSASDTERERVGADEALAAIDSLITKIQDVHEERADGINRHTTSDTLLAELERILDGKVGEPFDDSEMAALQKEGERRFNDEVPPGFKDASKEFGLGDFFLWEQTLRHAAASDCDVVFVTGERKPDWFEIEHGEVIGPRRELVREFLDRTSNQVIILNTESFLRRASSVLGRPVSEDTFTSVAESETADQQAATEPVMWTNQSMRTLVARLAFTHPPAITLLRTLASSGSTPLPQLGIKLGTTFKEASDALIAIIDTEREMRDSGVIDPMTLSLIEITRADNAYESVVQIQPLVRLVLDYVLTLHESTDQLGTL